MALVLISDVPLKKHRIERSYILHLKSIYFLNKNFLCFNRCFSNGQKRDSMLIQEISHIFCFFTCWNCQNCLILTVLKSYLTFLWFYKKEFTQGSEIQFPNKVLQSTFDLTKQHYCR